MRVKVIESFINKGTGREVPAGIIADFTVKYAKELIAYKLAIPTDGKTVIEEMAAAEEPEILEPVKDHPGPKSGRQRVNENRRQRKRNKTKKE